MTAPRRLLLDITMLGAFLAVANPLITGLSLHVLIGVTLTVPVLVHMALNWPWVERMSAKFLGRMRKASRVSLTVDGALFLGVVTASVSGLMVTPSLSALVALAGTPSPAWASVHAAAAWFTTAMFALHALLHWRWATGVVRRLAAQPRPSSPARVRRRAL